MRRNVADAVVNSQNIPIRAEETIHVLKSPRKVIEDLVDGCDGYVGIFHKKWGFVPLIDNPKRLSIRSYGHQSELVNSG